MTWRYCIIRKTTKIKGKTYHYYDIHEVYTDEDGSISWTEEPVTANGFEEIKHMQSALITMLKDSLEHPIMEVRKGKLVVCSTTKEGNER